MIRFGEVIYEPLDYARSTDLGTRMATSTLTAATLEHWDRHLGPLAKRGQPC